MSCPSFHTLQDALRGNAVSVAEQPCGREQSVGEAEKSVPKAGRIDHVGIQKCSEPIHLSLKAKLFIKLGQLVERLATRTLSFTPVGKNICGSHTPVCPHLPIRNLLLIKKLHKMRS